MADCLFCQISEKKIPAKIVLENNLVLAFRDINPQAPTHLLIIPRVHISSILELTKDNASIAAEMILLAKSIAQSEGADASGFRLVFNCGPHAGQSVDHLHLHLLAKRVLKWPPG